MLMLRLQRIGRRNEAHFKIVVIEKTRGPKSQKYVDIVGSYNPKLGLVQIDTEKAQKWLSQGVQPSDTVRNMLIDKGVLEGKKVNALPKKSPIVDEEKIAREKVEAEEKAAKEAETKVDAVVEESQEPEVEDETSDKESKKDSQEDNKEESQVEDDKEKDIVEEEVKKEDA